MLSVENHRPAFYLIRASFGTATQILMLSAIATRKPVRPDRCYDAHGCPNPSLDPLPRKAISSVPKLANWTPFALVIDALFVRAANYAIGHHDRSRLMRLDEFQYLTGNAGVAADITTLHLPVAQLCNLCMFGRHDANSDLCRLAQVRTVEGNCSNWPAPQSLPGFFAQALEKPLFQHICCLRQLSVHDWCCNSFLREVKVSQQRPFRVKYLFRRRERPLAIFISTAVLAEGDMIASMR
jgi:hypothetical protein